MRLLLVLALLLTACAPATRHVCRDDMDQTLAQYGTPMNSESFTSVTGIQIVSWEWPYQRIQFTWSTGECRVERLLY